MSDVPIPNLTPEQLDVDQALCDAASTGPWKAHGESEVGKNWLIASVGEDADGCDHFVSTDKVCTSEYDGSADTDAKFIAAARTGWPAAIAEVRRLREIVVRYQEGVHGEFCGGDFETCHNCVPQLRAALTGTRDVPK